MPAPEPVPERLMAYLDGEMSAEEAKEFARVLEQHPEWREEAGALAAISQAADQLVFKPPPVEMWDNYWEEIDSQLTKRTGWTIAALGGGILALIGTGKILFLAESPWVRGALGLVIGGMILLFVAVLRGHLLERPRDRYRRIRR